jgi:hypothetical protein
MSNWLRRSLFIWVIAACLPLLAQEFQAGISGLVKDTQGAVMPGVTVEATNVATNDVARATTNEAGLYSFPVLPMGTYRLKVAPAGFKEEVRDKLELRLGDRVVQDFTMQVGAVNEVVTVSAGTELLQTSAVDKGQVVSEENVHDLPSVARNPFLLGIEAAGVQFDIGSNQLSRSARPFDAGNNVAESMSINGGLTGASDLLLDGVPNTGVETGSSATNQAFVPTPEAVSEFKMQSSNYDAQYGRTAGGTMTVSIKNGTNKPHGAVYWLNKNTIDEANLFDQNRLGKPRAAFNENNPGLEFDGPLYLPHLYDGRNRTFFMYSYEIWRDAIPAPTTYTVPQPAALQGNFNTTLQSNGLPIAVYDPTTTTLTGTGSNPYTRTPFPGDIIPTSVMNPVGVKLATFFPTPNVAGQTNNLITSPNQRTDAYDAHVARVDQVLSDKERFFTRIIRGYRTEVNGTGGFVKPAGAGNAYSDGRLSQGANFDLTSVLSPSTVLTSRVGYIRHDLWITLYASGFDPTTLGFPASLLKVLPPFFPTIAPSGYQTFGAARSGGNQFTESGDWSWSETVNRTVRRHNVKFGGEFRVLLTNIDSPTTNFGSYSFNSGWTQQNATSGNAAYGNAIASMLLGMPSSGSVPINPAYAYGGHYYGVFLQDDWRLTNKLTLSYGVRWDYESPITERNNQMDGPFNFNANSPLQVVDPLQPGLVMMGGMTFTGPNDRMAYQRDLNNVQPRVGIAWHPTDKTVVRAGYGMSYVATFNPAPGTGFATSTPYNSSPDGGVTFSGNYLTNPYPTGIVMPSGSSLGLATYLGNSISYIDPNRVIPRVNQFSVSLQRQLPFRSVLEVTYAGSRSQELNVSQNLDAISMANLLQYGSNLTPNLSDSCSATSTTCPYANPFYGKVPSTVSLGSSATTSRSQLLLPYPQFTGITETNIPVGLSWYNSLQVRYEKRVSHGLNVLVSYTHERWLNATGYLNAQEPITQTPDRSLNGTDTPHRIVISGNWAIPLFAHTHGIVGIFLKGWQANGIFMRESGFPLGLPGGYISTGISPALHAGAANETRAFNTCTILTTVTAGNFVRENCANPYELPAFYQLYGNVFRVMGANTSQVRPPKVPNADVSMFKAIALHEGWRLQFRAECFNCTNSPQFGGPSTSLTSTSAGSVTLTQVNDQRNMQLSLRVTF